MRSLLKLLRSWIISETIVQWMMSNCCFRKVILELGLRSIERSWPSTVHRACLRDAHYMCELSDVNTAAGNWQGDEGGVSKVTGCELDTLRSPRGVSSTSGDPGGIAQHFDPPIAIVQQNLDHSHHS